MSSSVLRGLGKGFSRGKDSRKKGGRARPRRRAGRALRPWGVEALEGRALLATVGVDYKLSGFQWADPGRITYSVAPDGAFWDHGTNQLNAVFDAKFGGGTWEREIARALATWQSVADVNIVPVADSGKDLDANGLAQGDSRFGDIRVGGYPFPGNTTTLAETFFPPPNGTTSAGDVVINTNLDFRIGEDFDLYSVLLHETGHSLGLDHPSDTSEVLHGRYGGVRSGLSGGDLAGIRAIYGPREPDAYSKAGVGTGFSNPIDVTRALDPAGRATVAGVSLDAIGETEYFSVVAPAGAAGTLRVTAAAGGNSLLSPKVSLFDADGRLLDAEADPSAWSNDVTATAAGVAPGRRYVAAVTGATPDVFSVGAYALRVEFDGASPGPSPAPAPAPAPPRPLPTPTAPAVPPDRFESQGGREIDLGSVSRAALPGLTLHTPADLDTFVFQAGTAGVYNVNAAGTGVRILDSSGRVISQGSGQASVRANRAGATVVIEVSNPGTSPVADYDLLISSTPTAVVYGSPWSRWTSWRAFSTRYWSAPVRAQMVGSDAGRVDRDAWVADWLYGRQALGLLS